MKSSKFAKLGPSRVAGSLERSVRFSYEGWKTARLFCKAKGSTSTRVKLAMSTHGPAKLVQTSCYNQSTISCFDVWKSTSGRKTAYDEDETGYGVISTQWK